MFKKALIIMMIVAVAMFSFACGEKASNKSEDTKAADTSSEESAGSEWPSQYMSTLPAPDSKISRVEKLNGTEDIAENDTTTQPSSVNIVMNEMTKDEALAYYDTLKNSGFEINTDEKSKDKILLVGTLNDADKNPFLFSYIFEENFGNVSITILKEVYADGGAPSGLNPDDSSAASGDSTVQ